jgi:hypothetical protein
MYFKPIILTLIACSVSTSKSFSQTVVTIDTNSMQPLNAVDTVKKDTHPPFYIDGYADVYFASYSDNYKAGAPATNSVIAPKNNSLGLNILQLSGNYTHDDVRGKITLQFGDVPTQAWPADYKYVQEAYVGARLGKKTWLDAGFFKTHIGAEIIPGRYNLTSTIAMVTFHEPFFQGGLRLVQETNSKFNWGVHLLDGFNKFTANTALPAIGFNSTYIVNSKLQIMYNNLLSDEELNNNFNLRFYNNINIAYERKKWKVLLGLDIVTQQTNVYDLGLANYADVVVGGLLTLKYQAFKKVAFVLRPEYFYDRYGTLNTPVNITKTQKYRDEHPPQNCATCDYAQFIPENPDGYKTAGITLGAELKLHPEHYFRVEVRYLNNFTNQQIYDNAWGVFKGNKTNQRLELVLTTGLWFDK